MTQTEKVLLITGPAGSGKSSLAEHIADKLGWDYISEDEYWVKNGWSGNRSEEQEKAVQQEVSGDLLSKIQSGHGVVLEFILYKQPPNPLTAYQEMLSQNGVAFDTVVLKPAVQEIMKRIEMRGRPNDLANLKQVQEHTENQIKILSSEFIKPKWIVEPDNMTVAELACVIIDKS